MAESVWMHASVCFVCCCAGVRGEGRACLHDMDYCVGALVVCRAGVADVSSHSFVIGLDGKAGREGKDTTKSCQAHFILTVLFPCRFCFVSPES